MNAIPSEIQQIFEQAQTFISQERQDLLAVLEYFVELNRTRAVLLDTSKKISLNSTPLVVDNIVETLTNYRCVNPRSFLQGCLDPELAAANLHGSKFAFAIWEWAKCLRWSGNGEDDNYSDLGVSWLELLMIFFLRRRCCLQYVLKGKGQRVDIWIFSS